MSDEKSPIARAEEAVCDQIVARAEAHAANEQRAGELKKLAEGVAAMKHGPQGGAYNSHLKSDSESRSRSTSDNHTTDHAGEERPRPPAGFVRDGS